ncbi:tRNA (adenosine(37)-N6)-threonylcarbamoyltransferase complex dimerization subunit type 1 TsaB [Virgibacillus sp. MSJ-26]|uniref:tRNA (adenosine(37)-N6)-threonylcarbamoyltransferase complex dimerization subunit type 1 TsaB n=1 Tax=Virgibacillus sp. MSJ-26 TaxID=2841522 RepID=UPI001C102D38|nr:tRNA (adenosine(37)-N6)-threonylcarbamoyltransferase complex dimerization subunit type 1 TsaB [Virgibacillus sp. MSJ-26]MBU5466941.1 tRNA (adenosine(37)-N6)-threonylcarbamoyltransferase complex dimerization subunit type 1 TsaB [Virgibacillus sp. MSJ-26]
MYSLTIDTSNHVLGVALMKGNKVIGEFVTNLAKNHSVRLMPAVDQLMKEVDASPEQLDKIIVAKGPGSYTGVRIGLTTAKTLAWALDIPVVGVSSLKALAYQGRFYNSVICPFFDARRGLVYTGLYEWQTNEMVAVHKEQNILMYDWLTELSKREQEVLFLSPDIEGFSDAIQEKLGDLAIIPEDMFHIAKPSDLALAGSHQESESTHHLTPNYLRLAEAEANWIKTQGDSK